MCKTDDNYITISKYFAGRCVFVTGGSGFMGKVLIEKLLRSCPQIECIFMLLRPKKGHSIKERVRQMLENPLFDKIKKECPQALETKLIPILGDVRSIKLGLSPTDYKLLTEKVSIVYHVAATVRFDEPLKEAVIMNTRGTREVCQLLLEMDKIAVFIHVSTAYCHTDKQIVGEQLYPAHTDWRQVIEVAEKMDEQTLQLITPKYMEGFPNTYTFTKSLAEHVVNDFCAGKIPAVIIRPTIVISTDKDPMAGWSDNFNGPNGLFAGCAAGIIQSILVEQETIWDFIPVDLSIKGLIKATKIKGVENKTDLEVSVYNCSNNKINATSLQDLLEFGKQFMTDIPCRIIWYPSMFYTQNKYRHFFRVYLYQLLPAICVDFLLRLNNTKPFLLKVQRKIFVAMAALQYFLFNDWVFLNDKFFAMDDNLQDADIDDFGYKVMDIDSYKHFRNGSIVGKSLLLKEDPANEDYNRRHLKRMYILQNIVKVAVYGGLIWLFFIKWDILSMFYNRTVAYLEM